MKVDWAVSLSEEFTTKWFSTLKFLSTFNSIHLPRHYLKGNDIGSALTIELHGFYDASVKVIAVVLYVRVVFPEKAVCSIVTAKTKVVPLNKRSAPTCEKDERYTVPKLELSGCSILS